MAPPLRGHVAVGDFQSGHGIGVTEGYASRSYGIFSPASIAIGSRFSAGGSGQVARSVNAHGRFTARLKSSVTEPSASGAARCSPRFAAYVVTPEVASL